MILCLVFFVFAYWLIRSILFPLILILVKFYILAPRDWHIKKIQNSGEWAVVTGATDGIGREYARQLAKIGMKIFLIGRDEDKLQRTANELKQYYKIETSHYKADFCKTSIYEGLDEVLAPLDIGVLVNNVGMTQPHACKFKDLNLDHSFFSDMINCNIVSAVSMTKIVLPKMVEHKRGIIINISSASSLAPMPLSALYSSSKCYLTQFSRSLSYELSGNGVTVQTVRPFFVQTKFIGDFRPPRLFTPSADEFVSSAIRMVGIESDTFGTLSHSIQGLVVQSVPLFLHLFVAEKIQRSRAQSLHRD